MAGLGAQRPACPLGHLQGHLAGGVTGRCCHLPLSSASVPPRLASPGHPWAAWWGRAVLLPPGVHLGSREQLVCRETPVCIVEGQFIHFYFHPEPFSFVPTVMLQGGAKLVPCYLHHRVAGGVSQVHWH